MTASPRIEPVDIWAAILTRARQDIEAITPLRAWADSPVRISQMRGAMVRIISGVSALSGVTSEEIAGPDRRRRFAHARQAVMFIAHREGMSISDIARGLGRNHTTVRHGIDAESRRRQQMEPDA